MVNNSFFGRYGALMVIGSLFFVFGFVTWANSILIPYFKLVCELSVQQSLLVAFAFYISYFAMAFPSSYILGKTGYKNGMLVGLLVMAAGALIFIPAAGSREYTLFLTGLFVQATGLTLLQTAANPYIIVLGPIESAAARMSIMGVCNKVAGTLAPILLIGAIVRHPDEIDQVQQQLLTASAVQRNLLLDDLSARLLIPYLVIAGILVLLGLMIKFTHLPEIKDQTIAGDEGLKEKQAPLFKHTYMLLGAVAIFCAVNVEVLVVDSIIQYAQFTGKTFRQAKYYASYTLVVMIASYLTGIVVIPRFITQRRALAACGIWGFIFSGFAIIIPAEASLWCLVLLGFGNALLWPAIWPLALNGLGKHTSKGSALLIMGVVGAAVGPLLYGMLAALTDQQKAYLVLLPCYAFILYFALRGYKAGKNITAVPEK